MAVTVPVLFLLLVPHTRRPWGVVGWGIAGEEGCLQALEDRAPGTCSRQPGKAEHQEWPALPWFPESGLGHWGAVVGSDTLAHSPAQTSAMLTSYKFTSSFNLLFGRWSHKHRLGAGPGPPPTGRRAKSCAPVLSPAWRLTVSETCRAWVPCPGGTHGAVSGAASGRCSVLSTFPSQAVS